MTAPNFSVLHGANPSLPLDPATEGAAHLHLAGPVQVHIHLGQASQAAAQAVAPTPRRFTAVLALVGIALAGGGYLAGSRHPALQAPDAVALPLPAALPAPPDGMLPAMPQRPGDLPAALQQQLARPAVVTPPPGSAAAPARNPFGLGN